ncbi:MAG: tyrosine-type recombinase/integrase [Candidatus Bathyarchaeales archaeon]
MRLGRKIDKRKLPPILRRYDDYMAIRFSPRTREGRLYRLIEFHEFMVKERGKNIEQMARSDIEAYIAKLTERRERKEIKQHTVKSVAGVIKMFAKWLVREEILDSKEFYKIEEDIKELPDEKGEDNRVALTEEEEKRILTKLVDILHQFIVWLGLNFGLRLLEYCNLRVEHVELDRGKPRLKIELSKGHIKKTRYIPITPLQASRFREWLDFIATLKLPHNFLLYNPRNPSQRLTVYSLGWMFRKMSMITGEHLYSHRLRYTYAVKLWKHGVDLWTISLALGHEKVETTVKYLKIHEEDYYEKYMTGTKGLFH